MEQQRMRSIILAACIALLAFAATATAQRGEMHEKSAALKHLETLDGKEFEREFLKLMTHHHQSGIAMAELAGAKASRAEVRELGEKISAAQERESGEMTGWLKDWFGEGPKPHFRDEASEEKMQREMAGLKAAEGGEFDRLFLAAMTMHHRNGMAMAELVPAKAKRDEVIEAAKKMSTDQGREVEQMVAWKSSWFGRP